MLNTWKLNGVLVEEDYRDPIQRKVLKGIQVVAAKRPGCQH